MISELPNKETFRILVSTDNHLGYKETQSICGNDSFDAFEEVIQIAKAYNVDFVLLGGDLFHEVSPSQSTLFKCVSLLEKHVFGDRPINFIINRYKPNYSNENINIELPIFVIHGSHDYPSADENISALDILQSCNLINYFGKQAEIDNIVIEPILFEKGRTKIALYGLGHIKDTKLFQAFDRDQVKFIKPPSNEYFCILLLHQNRYKGARPGKPFKNCIYPQMLPKFMSLVIWGNDHTSVPEIIENSEHGFYMYQPGSSTVTSLVETEVDPKHVGILEITAGEFEFKAVYLERTRPLVYKSIELNEYFDPENQRLYNNRDDEGKEAIVSKKLEAEIDEIIKKFFLGRKDKKLLPLVRVKVEYTGFDIVRVRTIEAKYQGKVANEGDILKFWKKIVHKPKDDRSILQNARLTNNFEETIQNKESFGALQTEANEIIRTIFGELLQEERRQPHMIQLQAFFDRIPEINLKNSHQKVVELIQETDLSRELTAQISANFVQTTNHFINGASQLIENNYEQVPTMLEKLKEIDKEYDIPFKNLKNNIMEFTQELSTRSTTASKPPSTMKDNLRLEVDEHDKRRKKGGKGTKGRSPEDGEDGEEVISYSKKRGGNKAARMGDMEEEEDEEVHPRVGGARFDNEERHRYRGYMSEEEDPEANIFDEEFGKPIEKVSPLMPVTRSNKTSNARSARKTARGGEDDDAEEFVPDKKSTKRKAPATQTAEVAASQGKRVRVNTSKAKEGRNSTSKNFL